MRTDENGEVCPSTLGEYRDLVAVLSPGSLAVEFLDKKIAEQGGDESVAISDLKMRAILYPMMLHDAKGDQT